MVFYFSGTGNSAWIAKKVAQSLCDRLINMGLQQSLDNEYVIQEGEKIGFVFPVYAWGPPTVVLEFISKVKIVNPGYIFFICTCGDDTGLTPQIFDRAIHNRRWKCSAGFSITMPNTYVSLPGFDIDDEAMEKNKVMCAKARMEHIMSKIKDNVVMNKFECYEGTFPAVKSMILRPLFNTFLMSAKSFHVTDACIGCGRCERRCPVNNIQVDNKPSWGNRCTQCMACYHSCPVHAIEYGKMTKGKGQYKGKYIKETNG